MKYAFGNRDNLIIYNNNLRLNYFCDFFKNDRSLSPSVCLILLLWFFFVHLHWFAWNEIRLLNLRFLSSIILLHSQLHNKSSCRKPWTLDYFGGSSGFEVIYRIYFLFCRRNMSAWSHSASLQWIRVNLVQQYVIF